MSQKRAFLPPRSRVALLEDAQVEKAANAFVPLSTAQDVLLHSFTIRAKLGEGETVRTGSGVLRDVILVGKEHMPVCLGNVILEYDDALGAIVRQEEGSMNYNILTETVYSPFGWPARLAAFPCSEHAHQLAAYFVQHTA